MNLQLKIWPAITWLLCSGLNGAALEEGRSLRRRAVEPSLLLEKLERPKRMIIKPPAIIEKHRPKKQEVVASLPHDLKEDKITAGSKRKRDSAAKEPEEDIVSKGSSKASGKKPFTEEEVILKRGKKGRDTFYWHIEVAGVKRGHVSINSSSEDKLGKHYSIQVFINKKDQGRHLGSIAYKLACLNSGLDVVYAHMRKSNSPSRKAAQNGGFKIDTSNPTPQLTMKWLKPK